MMGLLEFRVLAAIVAMKPAKAGTSNEMMNIPEPEPSRFQFSLRSLMLFSTLVAIVCSIGVTTDWSIAASLGAIFVIGAVCGGMVSGKRAGIIAGAVYGIPGFAFALVFITILLFPISGLWAKDSWEIVSRVAVVVGGILGGISGGIAARRR
jgi:hypothetical protein